MRDMRDIEFMSHVMFI